MNNKYMYVLSPFSCGEIAPQKTLSCTLKSVIFSAIFSFKSRFMDPTMGTLWTHECHLTIIIIILRLPKNLRLPT